MNATSTPATILASLRSQAETQGERTVYTFLKSDDEQVSVTYRELDERARGLANALLHYADPGDRALLTYPAGLDFIEAFLACLYAGIVAVPAYPPKRNRNASRILSIAEDCSPRLLLCTSELKRSIKSQFADSVFASTVIATDDLATTGAASLPAIHGDQLAFLQYTSGSTAEPKGVMVTHQSIIANETLIEKHFDFSKESTVVSWLPMFHDMGLVGAVLAPLFVGFPSVLMPPNSFLREPIRWLLAVTRFRATCTGAPNFAYDLCVSKTTAAQRSQLDLSTLNIAYNGAEPVRAKTLERFSEAFADCGFNKNAFFPCYGMAESTLLVSGGPPLATTNVLTLNPSKLEQHRICESARGTEVVSCGQVDSDLPVRIVDPEPMVSCDSDEIGEIWIQGASVSKGYWNRPEESLKAFQCRLDNSLNNWFRTGDYGFLKNDELYVTGRLKDLIIIRGRNIYPQDVEQAVEQHLDFVEPNSCSAFSVKDDGDESLTVVAEGTREMVRWARSNVEETPEVRRLNQSIDDLRASVLDEFDAVLRNVVFVRPTTFPRTSSGKIQRQLAKRMWNDDELDVVFQSNVSTPNHVRIDPGHSCDTVSLICRALREWANDEGRSLPVLHGGTTFSSIGIDSLAAADVGIRLERALGIPIEGDMLYQQRTIMAMGAYLASKIPMRAHGNNNSQTPLTKEELIKPFKEGMQRFQDLRHRGIDFFATEIERHDGNHVWAGGSKMLMMASYSYLGLMNRPEVKNAAQQAIADYGTGAHGVRLLAGTLDAHCQFEREIASFYSSDDAIVYTSGFITNVATIAALVGQGDVVIGDELNHASIFDGCESSQATFLKFAHSHIQELESLLKEHSGKRILVVIDAVYSMDGDIAPLPDISSLCQQYGALLMVDEAHSLGVIGRTGKGILEHFGLSPDAVDIKMGTLSKAIPSCGGFVAARQEIIDYLKFNARGFVFSSALPAAQLAAARKCLQIIQDEPELSRRLDQLRTRFVAGLEELGFEVPPTESAIVPIIFSSEDETLEAVRFCRSHGLFVVPVFYPAVPMDKPRIRATVMASFSDDEIEGALDVFGKLADLRSNLVYPDVRTEAASTSVAKNGETDARCRTRGSDDTSLRCDTEVA